MHRTKRRRLTRVNPKETVERTVNHSLVPSINQSQSLFCQLASPVFALVCEYLDLDCKCRTLSVLSQDVRAKFEPATCCRGEVRILLQVEKKKVQVGKTKKDKLIKPEFDRCVGRSAYLQYASSITAEFDGVCHLLKADRDAFISKLSDGIANPNLTSLYLQETWTVKCLMLIPLLKFSRQEQMIKLCHFRVHMRLYGNAAMDMDSLSDICDLLPDAVTDLEISSWYQGNFWKQRLSDPSFLPNLKHFSANTGPDHIKYLRSLATVMTKTERPRPIEYLRLPMRLYSSHDTDLSNAFHWCWNVKKLSVEILHEDLYRLCSLPDSDLPALEDLDITVNRVSCTGVFDMTSLFEFMSKRPIVRIKGDFFHEEDWGDRIPISDQCAPIPVHVVRDMSRMRMLRSMEFGAANLSGFFEHFDHLPVNCWPHLEHFTVSLNQQNAKAFVKAAPSIKCVIVDGVPVRDVGNETHWLYSRDLDS